jgi:Thrombospondin type 3 repeat
MMRPVRAVVLIVAMVVAVSCETIADPYLPQAAVSFSVTDTAVSFQRAPLPAPQIVIWDITEMSLLDLTDFDDTFEFLQASPCTYQLNALAPIQIASACRVTGLSLKPGPARMGVLHLTLTSLELRTAARPDLSPGADPDGDGVPNSSDNCPIVFNPAQDNFNPIEPSLAGDACSYDDTAGDPTISDQDLDGVRDTLDNCLFYPSPAAEEDGVPVDANRDGIGDACERIAPVVIPAGTLQIECAVTFTPAASRNSHFRLDFGAPGVLTCDAGFTGCVLDPSALKAELLGTTQTFDCHQAL